MVERTAIGPNSPHQKEAIMDRRVGQSTEEHATTTEARQAIAPHRLRYMLAAGIAAVVLGFLAVYFMIQ